MMGGVNDRTFWGKTTKDYSNPTNESWFMIKQMMLFKNFFNQFSLDSKQP